MSQIQKNMDLKSRKNFIRIQNTNLHQYIMLFKLDFKKSDLERMDPQIYNLKSVS